MTKLLVSVRDAAEAKIALDGGVDLVDIKEPTRGALGAPDSSVVRQIVTEVAGRVPVSVALGELNGENNRPAAIERVQYAKLGLAGCGQAPDWQVRWRRAIDSLPRGVSSVAVAYADWDSAGAPDPHSVLETGASLGCRVLLIDTFTKSRGTLVDHLSMSQLRSLIRGAHRRQLRCALAGSLDLARLAEVLPLRPDFVAVRAAACAVGRTGRVDADRVGHLAALVHGQVTQGAKCDVA